MATPDVQTLREKLAQVGAAHAAASERLDALRTHRAVLVAQGFDAGIQPTYLAEHVGLSRQRLYQVRNIGAKQLENTAAVPREISAVDLLNSLMSVVTALPRAEREKAATQADLQRVIAQVAADGRTPVRELAQLAGVSREWTRKVRIRAGLKPRRYSPIE